MKGQITRLANNEIPGHVLIGMGVARTCQGFFKNLAPSISRAAIFQKTSSDYRAGTMPWFP